MSSLKKPLSLTSLSKLDLDGSSEQDHSVETSHERPKAVREAREARKLFDVPPADKSARSGLWLLYLRFGGDSSSRGSSPVPHTLQGNVIHKLVPDAVIYEPHHLEDHPDAESLQDSVVPPVSSLPPYSLLASLYRTVRRTLAAHEFYRPGTPPIKRVLIIGVHGFFPNRYLRPLIGHPTGTSAKFVLEAEKALVRYLHSKHVDVLQLTVQKIGLEREGTVFDRVDFFFQTLMQWQEDVLQADFVYIAAHSQGVPVSIMLVARLISLGFFAQARRQQQIGILAMAGVNLGPFYGIDSQMVVKLYKSMENESLLELFEFQRPGTSQSQKLLEALRVVCNYDVRICCVASAADQLVPVYSALNTMVGHPNMFRAVHFDGTPAPFVLHLVLMACRLLNAGHSDHGLLQHLSKHLQGPLTGPGHSTVYSNPRVYTTALEFFFETDPGAYRWSSHNNTTPVTVHPGHAEFSARRLLVEGNPYELPWCFRGMVAEWRRVHGSEEVQALVEEYTAWTPTTKPMKDMRYRLGGLAKDAKL